MNNNHNKILIGEKLKDIRQSLGLTQEQVSEKLGLAPRYLSDIERNKTKGSLNSLIKLCNIYNTSLDYIFADYLNSSCTDQMKFDDNLIGYNQLDQKEKELIIHLIQFMNKQKNK